MKRLVRISVNSAIFSFIPILSWFALGLLVEKSLTNIFMLTYPIQFVLSLLLSIFGTGANLSKEKDKDENAVLTGMTIGIIVGFIIFGTIALNIKSYISFMHMDINIYKEFALYSVIQLYIQLVFSYVLEKLYYEDREKEANKYCFTLNVLNFVVLVVSSLIFKEKILIVIITLISIFLYVFNVTLKEYKNFHLKCNIYHYIKYNSVSIFNNFAFFIIYLFGLSNALNFAEKYVIALNFVALITDTQWDTTEAITTVAKIDISKGNFNYREHLTNAYKLIGLLLITSFILFILLFKVYHVNLYIGCVYLAIEVFNFAIYPIYEIKTCYLQLEWSSIKTTTNKIASDILRMLASFLKTPFCTGLGQIFSSTYQFVTVIIFFDRNYKIDNNGYVKKI